MSFTKIEDDLMKRTDLDLEEKIVLARLLRYEPKTEGWRFIKHKTLATALGAHIKVIRRVLSKLEKKGFLSTRKVPACNGYKIHLDGATRAVCPEQGTQTCEADYPEQEVCLPETGQADYPEQGKQASPEPGIPNKIASCLEPPFIESIVHNLDRDMESVSEPSEASPQPENENLAEPSLLDFCKMYEEYGCKITYDANGEARVLKLGVDTFTFNRFGKLSSNQGSFSYPDFLEFLIELDEVKVA